MTDRELYGYERKPRGHKWATADGELDIFAYEEGEFCNGPRCTVCDYGFCHHCQDGPDVDCR